MTTYEEVLARHGEDSGVPLEYAAVMAHDDRAWLLAELRRAEGLLAALDDEAVGLRQELALARSERGERLFALFERAMEEGLPRILAKVRADASFASFFGAGSIGAECLDARGNPTTTGALYPDGELARERSRGAWEPWTAPDVGVECAPMFLPNVTRDAATPKPTLLDLGEAWRERCAREADAEVRTGEHRILKAQFSDHVAIAQTMIATGTTIAKRIRELR